MRRSIVMFALLILSQLTYSSHLAGGEFRLTHVDGNIYRLSLIAYFDVVNGNPGALDPQVVARIFRKDDNVPMMLVTIPLVGQERIGFYQPDCSNGEVVMDEILYTTTIVLDPSIYNDQKGYYVAWERCCRNYSIDNVKSIDISSNPGTPDYAGQTFYLEFPPVVDINGNPFINSSPEIQAPLNDHACPLRNHWLDFKATDDDGDLLVYSLVTPFNTHEATATVLDSNGNQLGANPGPYPEVQWDNGYSIDNIMGGDPDLSINNNGFLSVLPMNEGLYAFAIKCEEFRNGSKIGEVRRDFQMLVVDQCPEAEAPVISGRKMGDVGYKNDLIDVYFSAETLDVERCIQVNVSDLDASNNNDNFKEEIYIGAVPLNFNEDVEMIIPNEKRATLLNGSSAIFNICFPQCPFVDPYESEYYEIGIVAYDDACALPLTDTLKVRVYQEEPINNLPYFSEMKGGDPISEFNEYVQLGNVGNIQRLFKVYDDDNQIIELAIESNYHLANIGVSFSQTSSSNGASEITMNWDYSCVEQILNFDSGKEETIDNEKRKTFESYLIAMDDSECSYSETRFKVSLTVGIPNNINPSLISTIDTLFLDIKDGNQTFDLLSLFKSNYNNPLNFEINSTNRYSAITQEDYVLSIEPADLGIDTLDVKVKDDNCGILNKSFIIKIDDVTSTGKMVFGKETAIYPNPFTSSVVLRYYIEGAIDKEVSLRVYSVQGILVDEVFNLKRNQGMNEYIYNNTLLESGIYLFEFDFNKSSNRKRVVKQ